MQWDFMKCIQVVYLAVLAVQLCCSLPLDQLYPFGPEAGDQALLKEDEAATNEISLRTPFQFFGETYFSLFVNTNGIVSFLTEIPYFFNAQFPLDYPVIAPFYADVDTTSVGNIYYRQTLAPSVVERVSSAVQEHFQVGADFYASNVFVATWSEVGAYQARRDKMNTFQVVLATDGQESYVLFNYADGGIQWLQSDGKTAGLPDALGQAGLIAADRRVFTLRGSGTDQARNLYRWSNVGQPGVWMFRVGKILPGKNIQVPDKLSGFPLLEGLDSYGRFQQVASSCSSGGGICHSSGVCHDYDNGFCCACNENSYGNGINCLPKDTPIRATGKLEGKVNGVVIEDSDFHSYVLSAEGRTYTAVSKIPKEVGFDLQSLTAIGEGVAWLFAIPRDGVSNGFSLTGGIFNRSVEVTFPQTGHSAVVDQVFEGLDVFNNVAVHTKVTGSLPTVPIGSELEVSAFAEEFTRIKPGQLRAHSSRNFRLKGQALETPYKVETFIYYDECEHAPIDPLHLTLRTKVAENIFIRFDQAESIVRYSFTAKTGTLEEEDPCIKGKASCGPNSICIVDGDEFRCVCEKGYDYVYEAASDTPICLDINECEIGRDTCHINALCINTQGSYSCRCNRGFTGDGSYCAPKLTCNNAGCDPNASCRETDDKPICECLAGYKGDGFFCTPDFGDESCHIAQNCSPFALCVPTSSGHTCQCLAGYQGDGYLCELIGPSLSGGPGGYNHPPFNNQGPFYPPEAEHTQPDFSRQSFDPIFPEPVPTITPYVPYQEGEQTFNGNPSEDILTPQCILDVCWCPNGYDYNRQKGYCSLSGSEAQNQYDSQGNPLPICKDSSKCYCPLGFIYDSIKDQCDTVSEVVQGSFPLPICFKGTCSCIYGFKYHPETHTCHSSNEPGYDYSIKGGSARPCNVVNNCHVNAQCIYEITTAHSRCTCNAGFTGDGFFCEPLEVSCDQVDVCHFNSDCIYDDSQLRSVCVCKPGYVGDGLVCTPKDDCSSEADCDPNSQCLMDIHSQRYICKCNDKYEGDGFSCTPIQEDNCLTLKNCDPNADCIYEAYYQNYVCQCREGFEGDGHSCNKIEITCNIINNCGQNAECSYDATIGGYQCKCRQGFSGDGLYCQLDHSCLHDPSVCHINAHCQRTASDAYQHECVCSTGYTGDGFNCQRVPDHEKNILLLNQGLSVLRMPIDPSLGNGYPIHVDPYMTAVGADVDCLAGTYYWTDVGSRSIRSSKYDGKDRRPVITGGAIGSPEDVAVDWVSKNLYWTDSLHDMVGVSDLKGTLTKTVIEGDLVNPRGITVHPGLGYLFWSDWNRNNPKIEKSAMDGSGREILVSGEGVSLPNSLAVDFETSTLCWADAGTRRIECIGIQGYGRRVIIEGIMYPFGLSLNKHSFFYTDWNDTRIHEVSKYSGVEEAVRPPPLGGSGKLYGLAVVPEQCPPASNVCRNNRGNCPKTHLCLPNGRGGRTCACPDGVSEELCSDFSY